MLHWRLTNGSSGQCQGETLEGGGPQASLRLPSEQGWSEQTRTEPPPWELGGRLVRCAVGTWQEELRPLCHLLIDSTKLISFVYLTNELFGLLCASHSARTWGFRESVVRQRFLCRRGCSVYQTPFMPHFRCPQPHLPPYQLPVGVDQLPSGASDPPQGFPTDSGVGLCLAPTSMHEQPRGVA